MTKFARKGIFSTTLLVALVFAGCDDSSGSGAKSNGGFGSARGPAAARAPERAVRARRRRFERRCRGPGGRWKCERRGQRR